MFIDNLINDTSNGDFIMNAKLLRDRNRAMNELNQNVMNEIKNYLLDIHAEDGFNHPWCEGYIVAFVNIGLITDDEQDELIDWMNNIYN